MDMEEETADGGLFFLGQKTTRRGCVICMPPFISYYIGEMKKKMIISVFKITFYNLFLVSCFVLSESIYLWLRRASRNEFVCQESVC